jgi:hypothetical protein
LFRRCKWHDGCCALAARCIAHKQHAPRTCPSALGPPWTICLGGDCLCQGERPPL